MALGKQFVDVGADEATRRRHSAQWEFPPVDTSPRVDQLQLRGMNKVPMAEPHQQSQDEFTRDPRTWFHGRYNEYLPGDDPEVPDWDIDDEASPTFHLGTRKAAEDRLRKIGPGYNQLDPTQDQPGRIFPMRISTRMSNRPETARQDRGEHWPVLSRGQFYQNEFEDAGSVSAVLPDRSGAQTHQELVQQAIQTGKYVRPRVEAEFKAMGGVASPEGGKWTGWESAGKEYNPDLTYEHFKSRPAVAKRQEETYVRGQQRPLFQGGWGEDQLVKDPTTLAGAQWKTVPGPWIYPKSDYWHEPEPK